MVHTVAYKRLKKKVVRAHCLFSASTLLSSVLSYVSRNISSCTSRPYRILSRKNSGLISYLIGILCKWRYEEFDSLSLSRQPFHLLHGKDKSFNYIITCFLIVGPKRINKRSPPSCRHASKDSYELVGSNTNSTSHHISQHHHSLTNTQANNLLGTHDLNTRLRVNNSSVNVYFTHKFKLNLLFIRHEFAVDSFIVRHEFTKTRLWLGMSLQKLSFYQARVLSKLVSVLA
ncbi:hypothetical protein YC2023_017943 [Brassica napus]